MCAKPQVRALPWGLSCVNDNTRQLDGKCVRSPSDRPCKIPAAGRSSRMARSPRTNRVPRNPRDDPQVRDRPRLPRRSVIVRYWQGRGEPFGVSLGDDPACFACKATTRHLVPYPGEGPRCEGRCDCSEVPEPGWLICEDQQRYLAMSDPERCNASGLDRAHLADRCFGGLDGPQNLALLCRWCHCAMPVCTTGEEGFGYVLAGGILPGDTGHHCHGQGRAPVGTRR